MGISILTLSVLAIAVLVWAFLSPAKVTKTQRNSRIRIAVLINLAIFGFLGLEIYNVIMADSRQAINHLK